MLSSNIFWSAEINASVVVQPGVSIHTLSSIALADISGSTAGGVSQATKELLRQFNVQQLAVWNYQTVFAGTCNPKSIQQYIVASGGTQPSSIFQNTTVSNAISTCPVVYFLTDGEVDQNEVANFARFTNTGFSNQTLLCAVLIGSRKGFVKNANVSVFYPLLTHPRMLLLQHNGLDYRVIYASPDLQQAGQLQVAEDVLSGEVKFSELPTITPRQLLQLQLIPRQDQPCAPAGFAWLNQPDNTAVSLNVLMQTTTYEAIPAAEWLKLSECFAGILLLSKTHQRLQELRQWMEQQRESIFNNQRTCIQNLVLNNTALQRMAEELDRYTQQVLESTDPETREHNASELRNVRVQYNTLKQQLTTGVQQEVNWQQAAGRLIDIDRWLKALQQMESSDYRASDISSASLANIGNRAKRAGDVKELSFDENELSRLDLTNAPQIECAICMEIGTGCLMLREDAKLNAAEIKSALEFNGTDFCMDFPLACGRANLLFLSPDVVCLNCAKYLYERGRDTTQSRITALLPVVTLTKATFNARYIYRALANGLAERRALPHLHLLFFAILDAASRKDWGKDLQAQITFLQQQLLDYTQARSNFRIDGRQCALREALGCMSQRSALSDLLQQPMAAADVILRYGPLSAATPVEYRLRFTQVLFRSMLRRALAQLHPTHVNAKHQTAQLRFQVLDALFECPCGIPLAGSQRVVTFVDRSKVALLHATLLPDADWQIIQTSCPDLVTVGPLNAAHLTWFIAQLYSLKYDPVEKVATTLQLEHVITDYTEKQCLQEIAQCIRRHIIPLEPACVPEDKRQSDIHFNTIPSFATTAGPSLIACVCGDCFVTAEECHQLQPHVLWKTIQERRRVHMMQVYGCGLPPRACADMFNLHRTIVDFFESNGEVPTEVTRDLVIRCLNFAWKKGRNGQLGQLFEPGIPRDIAAGLRSYVDVLKHCNTSKSTSSSSSAFTWTSISSRLIKVATQMISFRSEAQVSVGDPLSRLQAELLHGYDAAIQRASTPIQFNDADRTLVTAFTPEEKLSVLSI